MPIIVIAEDAKAMSGKAAGATPTKEAVQPPQYCLPSSKASAPPLSAFYPPNYHTKVMLEIDFREVKYIPSACLLLFQPPDCLKELYYNKWNPPSSQRKLKGI